MGAVTGRDRRWRGALARSAEAAIGSGPAATTVVVLALVLSLDAADRSAVGALAPSLKEAFDISNTQIGLLAASFSIVGALATVPMGILADRVRRVALIAISVVCWSIAMGVSAVAVSFAMLFVARMFLGVVTAAAGPPVSSLIGDLYPPDQRGRVMSWVRSGELIGAGIGFLVSGLIVVLFTWRGVFVAFAAAGLAIAWAVWHRPEPERGTSEPADGDPEAGGRLYDLIEQQHVQPRSATVLHEDPSGRSLGWALRYTMRVRTIVVVIVAGSFGDFFFSGLQVFAVLYAVQQYGFSQAAAALLIPVVGIGALAGLLAGGRLGDALIARGRITGRVQVALWSFPLACIAIVPALLSHSILVALPFLVIGSALLTAPNPVLDAIRLDVVHPELRGRAEGIRSMCRIAAQASAPLVFGWLADHLAGGGVDGVRNAFLVTLPLLAANGLVLIVALRTYPRDVASVAASTRERARG